MGADLGVVSLPYLAYVLWLLGYPDQARTRSQTGWSLTREMAYPFTTALVGMSHPEHVRANARLVGFPPATVDEFSKLFTRGEGA